MKVPGSSWMQTRQRVPGSAHCSLQVAEEGDLGDFYWISLATAPDKKKTYTGQSFRTLRAV